MTSNLEITISDRNWPELELIAKLGPSVRKVTARCDQAERIFKSETDQFIKSVVQMQIERRKANGST